MKGVRPFDQFLVTAMVLHEGSRTFDTGHGGGDLSIDEHLFDCQVFNATTHLGRPQRVAAV